MTDRATHTEVPPCTFIADCVFATKAGESGIVLRLNPQDPECMEPVDMVAIARRFDAAMRQLQPGMRVYQYLMKRKLTQVEGSDEQRANYLVGKGLFSFELYLVVLSDRIDIEELRNTAESIRVQLGDAVPSALVDKASIFRVLRMLLNYDPDIAGNVGLKHNEYVDYYASDSPIEAHRGYLMVGEHFVKILTLKDPPVSTKADALQKLREIPCECILVLEWKPIDGHAARTLIKKKTSHFHNTKYVLNWAGALMAKFSKSDRSERPEDMQKDESASAMERQLGQLLTDMEVNGTLLGEFALTVIVFGLDKSAVVSAASQAIKAMSASEAVLYEERRNVLAAWFATLPGGHKHQLRSMYLTSANYADMSILFAPATGEVWNAHLNAECLTVLETRQRTPHYVNLHYGDVGHAWISGMTGCLAAGTMIDIPRDLKKYPHGVPIELLVGTQPYVYSYDTKNNRIALGKALRVWRTAEKAPVYRVKFQVQSGRTKHGDRKVEPLTSILVTSDHKFLLRERAPSGKWDFTSYRYLPAIYKGAADLVAGDRVMPFFRIEQGEDYAYIHLNNGDCVLENRFVLSEIYGERDQSWHGHHRDENKQNNSVDNLEWLPAVNHNSMHTRESNLAGKSGWQKSGIHPRGMKGKKHTPGVVERIKNTFDRRWEEKAKLDLWRRREVLNEMFHVRGMTQKDIAKHFGVSATNISYAIKRLGVSAENNHKIVSVEFAGYEDVYDMEVPGYNNFVANGVVVHNSGKSFACNFLLQDALKKYAPQVIIFDIGGSYKKMIESQGGSYMEIGLNHDFTINPFSLPDTAENRQFLFSFTQVLIESGEKRMLDVEMDALYRAIPGNSRLSDLMEKLPESLRPHLSRWVGAGQYGSLFDNEKDTLSCAKLQAFDFEGLEKYPQILEPLLFYVLHRASASVYDNSARSQFKIFLLDEAWRFFLNPTVKAYIYEALKTWRKRNAAIWLATQSLGDLSRAQAEMMETVAENCGSIVLLPNPRMDREYYRKVFKLNDRELDEVIGMQPKRESLWKPAVGPSKVLILDAGR